MENQAFWGSQRGTSLVLSLRVHERIKTALLLSPTRTTHVSTNEYRLHRQTCPGIQGVSTLILTSTSTHEKVSASMHSVVLEP